MEQTQRSQAGRRSTLTYTAISLAAALIFLVASSLAGGYPPVARFGGAVWIFMLAMIVTMPVITARNRGVERK